jgi:hypothetical protein
MAFGFRECCNQFSYFTVTGIPASVSEFEIYYIRTLEGLNFCATYVQIPTLNYQAPNYILLELSQQQNCDTCIESYPCPAEDIILVNQFTAGSVQIDTDCQVNTLQPMIVQCQPVNPTFSNTPDGSVALFVVGGTPPYTFISAGTQDVLSVTQSSDIYIIFQNVSAGTYSITTIDSTGDFSITRNCVLSGPPPIPIAVPIVTPASFFNAPDGVIDLTITGGLGPYTVIYEGEQIQLPLTGLLAGNYYFQVIDANEYLIEVGATVTQPDYPNYPTNLCATFTFCGTEFRMSFQLTSEFYNYRPVYNCTNPTVFGMTELKLRFELNFGGGAAGWVTTNELVQVEDIQFDTPPGNCNLTNNTFRLQRTGLGPLALPQGSFFGLGLIISTIVPVTVGGCPPKVRVLSTDNYCVGPPVKLGQVIYEAVGGSGPPYIYFYSSNGVTYQQTSATQLQLIAGTYSIKVKDSIGTESNTINFTISSANQIIGGSSVNYYSNVRSATITGTALDGPIQNGQYKEFNADIENFYDFADFPQGASFSVRFRTTLVNGISTSDYGYDLPTNGQILNLEITEAWYDNGNGQVNFYLNPQLSFIPDTSLYQGNLNYTENNLGFWNKTNQNDLCQQNIPRTSPNVWVGCDFTLNRLSFIEGDNRGKRFGNDVNFDSEPVVITTNTKIYIRYKIKLRNNMPVYIPTTFCETDITTIQPACYTPIGCAKLNVPNINNFAEVSVTQFLLKLTWFSRVLITPPTQPCVQIDSNGSNLNSTTPGGTVVSSTCKFILDSRYGVNEVFGFDSLSETQKLNIFKSQNTTSLPSWAP